MHKRGGRVRKLPVTHYYYRHRAACLAYEERRRRARGILARLPALTKRSRDDRLRDIILCNTCGGQVTTPSLILVRRHQCARCRRIKEKTRNLARGLTARGRIRCQKRPSAKDQYLQLKRGMVCVRCGFSAHPECLDFHHRDPASKTFTISKKVGDVKHETLLAEIEKCDVLCANCHRMVHAGCQS